MKYLNKVNASHAPSTDIYNFPLIVCENYLYICYFHMKIVENLRGSV